MVEAVHAPPAGRVFYMVKHDEAASNIGLVCLYVLCRYKAEKLQLDGRLYWNPCECSLPFLDVDGEGPAAAEVWGTVCSSVL